nr:unnamed protein product [Callosobruchus analis]
MEFQFHLEISFSAIRSRGRNNNNPTPFQFEHIYKRLLGHSQVKGSERANVTGLDSMSILYCSTLSKDENGENLLNTPEYAKISEKNNEMNFLSSPLWHLTRYCKDVVAYIAGFVVKCLKKCIA